MQNKSSHISLKFATAKKKRVFWEFIDECLKQKECAKQDFLKMRQRRKTLPKHDKIGKVYYSKYTNIFGLTASWAQICCSQAVAEYTSSGKKSSPSYIWATKTAYSFIKNPNKNSKYSHLFVIHAMGCYERKGTRKNRPFTIPVKVHKHLNKFMNDRRYLMSDTCLISKDNVRFNFIRVDNKRPPELKGPLAIDFDKDGQIHTSNNTSYATKAYMYQDRIRKALKANNKLKATSAKLELDRYIKSQFGKMLERDAPSKIILSNFGKDKTCSYGSKILDLCELYCVPSKVVYLAHRNLICINCGCKNHDNGSFFLAFFCERCETQQTKASTSAYNLLAEYTKRQTGSRQDRYAEYVAKKKAFEAEEHIPIMTEQMMLELFPEYQVQRSMEYKRRLKSGQKTETQYQQYYREWMTD